MRGACGAQGKCRHTLSSGMPTTLVTKYCHKHFPCSVLNHCPGEGEVCGSRRQVEVFRTPWERALLGSEVVWSGRAGLGQKCHFKDLLNQRSALGKTSVWVQSVNLQRCLDTLSQRLPREPRLERRCPGRGETVSASQRVAALQSPTNTDAGNYWHLG